MNCKQGDLAVYVRSAAGREGMLVACVRLATDAEIRAFSWNRNHGAVWVIDRPLPTSCGRMVALACDDRLRPIRPNDGEDETLTWAGKPEHAPVKEEA